MTRHERNNYDMICTLHEHTQPLAHALCRLCEDDHLPIWVVSAARTRDEQLQLWRQGRDANGKIVNRKHVVTWAKEPEEAPHCHRGAFDICPLVAGKLVWQRLDLFDRVAVISKELGMEPGAYFPANRIDRPHHQDPLWRTFALVD